ncbi:MAG: sodium:solute symporter family protein [Planctomycetota bacterium]|nr:sodium:solute symporter family protein [Planctomycetota bacterium]
MILAQSMSLFEIVVVLVYLLVTAYLGWLGYRRTKTAADYLVAGRKSHPFIMALSYVATFISTSAIVGFGGVAAQFGMSLLWLVFLNIFVGIFIAFVFLGTPTRRMGHALQAHTFPELLGRRYDSRFIQVFAGLVIFLFIPLYAAAVLIGGTEFMVVQFNMNYGVALLLLAVIVAAYVIAGGLKGVMYTDALQGVIMLVGMIILLVFTYMQVGGVTEGHRGLTDMAGLVPKGLQGIGHQGWTAMPAFGFGAKELADGKLNAHAYDLWWIVVSTITLGVGIGVLAQPQLVVRFMTVKGPKELRRALILGGVCILFMPGVAYTVGALSNLYFYKYEKIVGKVVGAPEEVDVILKKEPGVAKPPTARCELLHLDTNGTGEADTHVVARGIGTWEKPMPKAEITQLPDGYVEVMPHAISLYRAVVKTTAGEWMFNSDSIIPTFVKRALPWWFGIVFFLTLLAAAMSTLSSQFHTLGASIGHDVFEQVTGGHAHSAATGRTIYVVRVGIIIGLVVAVVVGYFARGDYFIARATAIFFELCTASFLPAFIGGLFWKRMTKAGALSSMITGFAVMAFWVTFIKMPEAGTIGLVRMLTDGKNSLLADCATWPFVDPMIIGLPLSILTAVVVSYLTKPPSAAHLAKCFPSKV